MTSEINTTTITLGVPRLPSGSTYKEVLVATSQNSGAPFPLKTNIYLPKEFSPEPTPLVLYIHGGNGAYNYSSGSMSYELSIALSDRGIAVATIDWRPEYDLIGRTYDVKAYVRYFRAHAKEYNIGPDKIGVWGSSQGGHLAAMLATTSDLKELEGDIGDNPDQSSCIQCAIIYYPPTDVFLQRDKNFPAFFLGAKDTDTAGILEAYDRNDVSSPYWKYVEVARKINPINYVTKNSAPVLISASSIDKVAPMKLCWALYNKFLEEGVDASFYTWSKGGHGRLGTDIETASANWIANKLLFEMAPKK